ncbi:Putative collagen-binding domain of a collagenase [Chitinophaga jiangningensis]|uniref:Putative collagen-binding domain of a collagenase n=1 Tax=Chitinophaga jiangningensis TaxID=1419482 RepID=A0A1M7ACX0_9BACT|nr:glycoside hydrolase family 140 protein [Chitinophaga jiangningensis]SHL40583.1 Putative collagen-binding domain of a collagenase [Chitinophaga jiangningensis]
MKKWLLTGLCVWAYTLQAQTPLPLKVSDNKHFLVTSDGKPFFWLGDTGWLLFVKCNREEAVKYLDTRKQQGFNVIQVMVLHDVRKAKNAYGDSALINGDVSKPNITTNKNNYWNHISFVIDEAAKRGMYIALVPVWGSNVKSGYVNAAQAATYARFLTEKYGSKPNIIWMNGGDIRATEGMDVWQTLGKTIKENDPDHLVTYHPRGRYSSSEWFHDAPWLDFNMFQSGHRNYAQDTSTSDKNHFGEDNWKFIDIDYHLQPTKPVLDGEPSYENIPHGLHDSLEVRWTAADLRRYGYWSVFAGGTGFTYGENAVMQFHRSGDTDGNYGVNMEWKKAVLSPGATQMQYLKNLLLSRSYLDRKPAQELLPENIGTKYDHLVATKGNDYAYVYTFTGAPFKVDQSRLGFVVGKASWYDPSNGKYTKATLNKRATITPYTPPARRQNGNDWVLVLEK